MASNAEDWGAAADAQEKSLVKSMADHGIGAAGGGGTGDRNGDARSESSSQDKEATMAEKSLLQKALRKGLIDNSNDIEIQRKVGEESSSSAEINAWKCNLFGQDPNSPLYSVKSFDALNLKPQLLKGVYGMGFNAPSKIQETALPTLLADPPSNMIAQSQSGTGKTAAFVLAMLSRVDPAVNHPQVS